MYCDIARFGSIAWATLTEEAASPAKSQESAQLRGARQLRKVFKLLNHYLALVPERVALVIEDVQVNVDRLLAGRRNPGSKYVSGDFAGSHAGACSTDGLEYRASRFPTKPIGEHPRRRHKPDSVRRDIIRLHHKLRILARELA